VFGLACVGIVLSSRRIRFDRWLAVATLILTLIGGFYAVMLHESSGPILSYFAGGAPGTLLAGFAERYLRLMESRQS
jgi:hypothetical protein